MTALVSLSINSIWVIGLSALLATASYLDWYRRIHRWTLRDTFRRPLALGPYFTSLALISFGLFLNSAMVMAPNVESMTGLWKAITWGGCTIIFAFQTILTVLTGVRKGWDVPIKNE